VNCGGTGNLVPLRPDALAKTDLEVQLRVEAGLGNSSGLTHHEDQRQGHQEQRTTIRSSHGVQIEAASSGRTANRVQTLSGLACRIQVSPCRPNSLAMRCSPVGLVVADEGWSVGVHVDLLSQRGVELPSRPASGRALATHWTAA
jgi:hypothetical protein